MFSYTVAATFTDAKAASEWVSWLRDEHLRDVLDAGALDAEVIELDGDPIRREVRYHFASRAAFDAYVRIHAPRLRAEGLLRFPPERGIAFVRSSGEVAATMPR